MLSFVFHPTRAFDTLTKLRGEGKLVAACLWLTLDLHRSSARSLTAPKGGQRDSARRGCTEWVVALPGLWLPLSGLSPHRQFAKGREGSGRRRSVRGSATKDDRTLNACMRHRDRMGRGVCATTPGRPRRLAPITRSSRAAGCAPPDPRHLAPAEAGRKAFGVQSGKTAKVSRLRTIVIPHNTPTSTRPRQSHPQV